jgi:hypothetical protein
LPKHETWSALGRGVEQVTGAVITDSYSSVERIFNGRSKKHDDLHDVTGPPRESTVREYRCSGLFSELFGEPKSFLSRLSPISNTYALRGS